MRNILSGLILALTIAIPSTGFSSDGLTPYQRAKLKASIRSPRNPGIQAVCNSIRIPNSKVLYKHPGSNHLPKYEQNTMTFIHDNTVPVPAGNVIKGFDSLGNLVTILGRKYPNYVVGNQPRYYNIPTGDKKTAFQVAQIIKNNTGTTAPVYLRVGNKICYQVNDLTNARFGF